MKNSFKNILKLASISAVLTFYSDKITREQANTLPPVPENKALANSLPPTPERIAANRAAQQKSIIARRDVLRSYC